MQTPNEHIAQPLIDIGLPIAKANELLDVMREAGLTETTIARIIQNAAHTSSIARTQGCSTYDAIAVVDDVYVWLDRIRSEQS